MNNIIMENNMRLEFDARSQNESLARLSVAAFLTEIDPTVEELNDIKTAVSEAVTNSIVHGYREGPGRVFMKCTLERRMSEGSETACAVDNRIKITIRDTGVGIDDIEKARKPLFTTGPEPERSGMGFMFMEMFMDKVEVQSRPGAGTTVIMEKHISRSKRQV